MTRLKRWIFETFLPGYIPECYREENEKLWREVRRLQHALQEEIAYREGMEVGLRRARQLTGQREE